eukprot:9338586-Pyramimonas_sp.AAC.1
MGTRWRIQLACIACVYAALVGAQSVDNLLEERAGYILSMRDLMLTTFINYRENVTTNGVPNSC